MKKITSLLLLVALTSTSSVALAQTMPGMIPVSGTLTDADGALLEGEHDITVSVYMNESGNTPAIFEQRVSVDNSTLHMMLDPDAKLAAAFASGEARYIEIEIDGEVLVPRIRLGAVPYALRAASADVAANANTLGGKRPTDFVEAASLSSSLASALTAALAATSPLAINEEGGKLTLRLAPCAESGSVWQSIAGGWTCRLLNRYVGSSTIAVNAIPGSMSDFSISLVDSSIEAVHIKPGQLANFHLSSNAQIEPSKIANTAAVLNGTAVQNFKTNTLVVAPTQVSINKPSAGAGLSLDVSGITKSGTFRADFFERSSPVTGTVKLPAAAFQVARGGGFAGDWQLNIDGYGQLTSTSAVRAVNLIAPIPEMPRDASISAMRCAYRISAGQLQGSYVELVRAPWASLTRTRNSLGFTNPAAGQPLVTVSKTISGFPLVNNETSHVNLLWNHIGTTANNSGLFFGCELDYTTTRL